ncbi:MAG: hypothetical protein DHS20C11_28160 [Lysobacteraceae bacterium]|nr:MAG: hypothetical protein DHS20C11_28160 [Xanthomonadaceae bacterium]
MTIEQGGGHLFVTGCPRSGTTALARLLNFHPQIAIGLERYKRYVAWGHRWKIRPRLFEPSAFLQVRHQQTNLLPQSSPVANNWYARLQTKLDAGQVQWVGDKVPNYYTIWRLLVRRFPHIRVLFILRDPVDVASSWQRRARNPKDRWPSHNDFSKTASEYNAMLRAILAMQQHASDKLLVVDYAHVFSEQRTLAALLQQIKLELTPNMAKKARDLNQHYSNAPNKTNSQNALTTDQQHAVRQAVDIAALNAIKSRMIDGVLPTNSTL